MDKTSESAIESMFDTIAPRYDFLNRLLSFNRDQAWRSHLIQKIPEHSDYLDLATGTGDVLIQAAKSKRLSRMCGADISANMLELAKVKAAKNSVAAKFYKMSALDLEFPDASFDCISIAFGIRNVTDLELASQEMARITRAKGKLLVLEFFPPRQKLMASTFNFYFRHVLPRIGGIFSNRGAYEYLPNSVKNFTTCEGFVKLFEGKGFHLSDKKSFLFGGCQLLEFIKS